MTENETKGMSIREILEEYSKYISIGTIEEFKALKEKSAAKKVREEGYCGFVDFECPVCRNDIHSEDEYCPNCGQKLDWQ